MRLSARLALGALALGLMGCVADGTDFEALPFFRVDRTGPDEVSVDVPPVLTTVDTFPAQRPRREESLTPPAGEDDGSLPAEEPGAADEEPDRDYYVRLLWPHGLLQKHGTRHRWSITGYLTGEGSGNAGIAGRAASGEKEVRADIADNFASESEPGGLRLLPFFVFSDTEVDHADLADLDEPRDLDRDIHLWPFLVYGTGDKPEHEYLAIAPFGGITKGILGKERIEWWGFPYPFFMQIQDRAYDSTHILFPFVNWIDGPQNSGFRIFPFFGHYERTGRSGRQIYQRNWVLWPFVTWATSGMNEEDTTDTFFLFPFFGRVRGPGVATTSVMWPFFKYEVRRNGHWELRAPFPFLQVASGPERFKFDLWPLFGYKHRPNYERYFFLWPIWRSEAKAGDTKFSGHWAMPVFQSTHWEYEDGSSERKLQFWPLFHYRSYRRGALDVAAFSIWWFDDPGWARLIAPFTRLYRYSRDGAGGSEHQALFGLFSYRDLPAADPIDDPARGLDYAGRPDYWRLSLLFGLFQVRQLGGETGLRFLWLPEFITWGKTTDP